MIIDTSKTVTVLPSTVGINQDLLNAPLFVLNPKSAATTNLLEVSWEAKDIEGGTVKNRFQYRRESLTPFPTVAHATYLDILLCFFVQNWNEKGVLHFRYTDVLMAAGKSPKSTAEPIQITIQRYMSHLTRWETFYADGRVDTLNYPIIRASSILDSDGQIIKGKNAKNPRRANSEENWHTVTFDKEVVKALSKNNAKRFLLTKAFKILNSDSFCVYRYFYGYPDTRRDKNGNFIPVSHNRSLDQLSKVFHWSGRMSRFKPWLEKRFADLVDHDLIHKPFWTSETSVQIACKNFRKVNPEQMKIKSETQGTFDINRCSDEILLAQYFDYKEQGVISSEECNALDMMLRLPTMKSAAIKGIREAIQNAHTTPF